MKKILTLCAGICFFALPLHAMTDFYQAYNGDIVMKVTDCSGEEYYIPVLDTDDDDDDKNPPAAPATDPSEEEQNNEEEKPSAQSYTAQASQLLVDLLLGNKDPRPQERSQLTQWSATTGEVDETDFEDLQETLLAYVKDVNWKTHLRITYRDLSWIKRLGMACKGVVGITKPARISLESWTGNLDQHIEQGIDAFTNTISAAARGHAMREMTHLSLLGLVDAVDTQNPFLLLLVDRQTFDEMVALEPKVATLYKDLYTFFKIRAIRMPGEQYDDNVPALIRVSELGKGNYFETWELMAKFARRMEELDGKGALNPQDEKDIHIIRLEGAVRFVQEKTNVERRAAEIAMADPKNMNIVQELKHGEKKKPSLDEKAIQLLQTLTEDEIKKLIFKYKMK